LSRRPRCRRHRTDAAAISRRCTLELTRRARPFQSIPLVDRSRALADKKAAMERLTPLPAAIDHAVADDDGRDLRDGRAQPAAAAP
jgi:hypothetical protein